MVFFSTSDVVSSDITAKAGATNDYTPVSHNVIFSASDSPQETTVSFDISVTDDDILENVEYFHLNLANVNGAIIGEPSVATVSIDDNDGTFPHLMYTISKAIHLETILVIWLLYAFHERLVSIRIPREFGYFYVFNMYIFDLKVYVWFIIMFLFENHEISIYLYLEIIYLL